MYKKFLTSNNTLNANVTRKATLVELIALKELSGTSTVSINTALYCIHNSVSCKTCDTCGAELEVENFVAGWKDSKRFCSTKCKAEFDPMKSTVGDVLTDYSLVLDLNGNPSSGKLSKFMNLNTVRDLQEKTGLDTDNISTLLYAVMNIDFVAKECNTCSKVMNIHNFKMGYREDQQFCSYVCKDTNDIYKNNLSSIKIGVSRLSSQKFIDNVMVPWYADRILSLYQDYDITTHTVLDDYIVEKKILEFSCNICSHAFVSNFSNNGRIPRCPICKSRSKQQVEISKFVASLGFDNIFNDRTVISPNEIDVYIPSKNVGIEYDGFYWHDDKDDSKKYAAAAIAGVRMIRVFEDDYKYKKNIVLSRIRAILGKTESIIYARKCKVVTLNANESRDFLNENHMQGDVGAAIKYGLQYNGILVAVMTFSSPRYDKMSQWELIRFANLVNTSVIGGASKLLSHFKKEHLPTSIVSYCDVRYGDGGVYDILGFDYCGKSQPNYFYYKKGVRHSRIKFQKHKLQELLETFDPLLTESENMSYNGYIKIHDNGNKIYKWNSQ